jgi:hypothetical protein
MVRASDMCVLLGALICFGDVWRSTRIQCAASCCRSSDGAAHWPCASWTAVSDGIVGRELHGIRQAHVVHAVLPCTVWAAFLIASGRGGHGFERSWDLRFGTVLLA